METLVSTTPTVHAKAVELAQHVLRMTTAAGSGHPSSALSLAHIVVALMYRHMRYDPADPWNRYNDRLVLSEGHAVPIVYAAYADLRGAVGPDRQHARPLAIDDLASLRELESVLDGHPNPAEGFPFFDAATGSLGQGLSVAAGLALAARLDGIDKRMFVLIGDGESREGQVWEAADFIVDHGLTNVCAVFSCNGHGQADAVSPQQRPDALAAKLDAFGWHAIQLDGHDPDALDDAFTRVSAAADRPVAVVARTIKGWGVDSIQGVNVHGKPVACAELDAKLAELDATAGRLGAAPGTLTPPLPSIPAGANAKTAAPSARPTSAAPARDRDRITLPPIQAALERVGMAGAMEKKTLATRAAYGAALVALGDTDDRIVSLDGDVGNSTYADRFARLHPDRFFECKIAEQNMMSVAGGLAAAGRIPFASSFAKFIARASDQIDMLAITRASVNIVGSHAGVSLGADGPSQMAVSDVAYFRSLTRVDAGTGTPVCRVFHPSDAVSTYRCCELMARTSGLCYMRTHRPAAPFLYPLDEPFHVDGCKQLRTGDRMTLVSAGYMLHTVLAAADELAAAGITCNVFDAYTLPLDAEPIFTAAEASGGAVLTVEDNYAGGLHAELAEAAARRGAPRVVGLTAARIPKSAATAAEVFSHVGVGKAYIMQQATELARP
ncbi:MAG: transketolase [Phycisphaerae bacterium]